MLSGNNLGTELACVKMKGSKYCRKDRALGLGRANWRQAVSKRER